MTFAKATQIARIESDVPVALERRAGFALTVEEMRARVEQLDAIYRGLMQEGTDYGVIPGTDKPSLYQPGAQILCTAFGYAPEFEELPDSVKDWTAGLFAVNVRCTLRRQSDGVVVSQGVGSCNSKEDKYRWRNAKPTCEACGCELRRAKDRPEWYCWKKQGGCGATYPLDAVGKAGKVENPDPYSLVNTIQKMAQKRALVAATLNATAASRIFTQDVEDLPEFQRRAPTITVDAIPVEPTAHEQARAAQIVGQTPGRAEAEVDFVRLVGEAVTLGHPQHVKLETTDPKALSDDQLVKSIDALARWVDRARTDAAGNAEEAAPSLSPAEARRAEILGDDVGDAPF